MKTLFEALCLGVIGGIAVYAGGMFQLPIWVMFIAWVSFSLSGNSVKISLKIYIQQLIGILIAIAVQYNVDILSTHLQNFTLPLVMCIVNILLLYVSKTKTLNSIPAYFVGMVIWFASLSTPRFTECLSLIIALSGGFLCAWFHTCINKWITEKIK